MVTEYSRILHVILGRGKGSTVYGGFSVLEEDDRTGQGYVFPVAMSGMNQFTAVWATQQLSPDTRWKLGCHQHTALLCWAWREREYSGDIVELPESVLAVGQMSLGLMGQ